MIFTLSTALTSSLFSCLPAMKEKYTNIGAGHNNEYLLTILTKIAFHESYFSALRINIFPVALRSINVKKSQHQF